MQISILNFFDVLISGAILAGVAETIHHIFPDTDKGAIEERQREIEDAELAVKDKPTDIKPIWELSKLQLRDYIDRNISQSRTFALSA